MLTSLLMWVHYYLASPGQLSGKKSTCNTEAAKGMGSIPGSGRSPGRGNGYPLQYSCLENPMDRGAWWATFHRVIKSWIRLKQLRTHTLFFS